ncbi:hypothetical protein [Novipirellula sp.]
MGDEIRQEFRMHPEMLKVTHDFRYDNAFSADGSCPIYSHFFN